MIEKIGQTVQTFSARPHAERVAEEFESAFLAEMLKFMDSGSSKGSFSGGIGEEQFSSFLTNHRARSIAAAGGLGLAEMIIRHYQPEHRES